MVSHPSDSRTPADTLDVKIVSLDHYRPRPDHRRRGNGPDPHPPPGGGHPQPGYPVVRVFGITRHTREKIAVHVHGVLPYFFVPMPVDLDGMAASGRLRAVERVAGERAGGLSALRPWKQSRRPEGRPPRRPRPP